MDRIRKNNDNNYDVLITPHHRFNSSVEFILGGWTDARLQGFKVKEYPNIEEAQIFAFNQPSLDWEYLVSLQKGSYEQLYNEMKRSLNKIDVIHNFSAKLLDAEEAKRIMFKRVKMYGERFRLCYNYNDLITFKIVNPWTRNLNEIEQNLKQNKNLKLLRRYTKSGIIHMIGQTDVNTTYEILLCPTLIDHWSKWIQSNDHLPEKIVDESLLDILNQQELLDAGTVLR